MVLKVEDDLKLVGTEPSSPFVDGKNRDQLTGFVADYLREWNGISLDGSCYRLQHPSTVEPSLSYAIVGINKILRGSMMFTRLRPSTGQYLKFLLFKKGREINIDSAVLFDGKVGLHYFHFFADVINKLWLFDKYGIDKTTPLIISRGTFQTRHFRYLYQNTVVGSFNWLIQEDTDFIKCKTLVFIKPAPYNVLLWNQTLALFANIKSPVEPYRRLFVVRPSDRARALSNIDTIIPILMHHGFQIIEPGALGFEEQATVFSEARYIISLDGSALTNMIFVAPQKVRILNIGALYKVTNQFYWLALMLNIKYYNCIFGSGMVDSKFEISMDIFENALAELLAA